MVVTLLRMLVAAMCLAITRTRNTTHHMCIDESLTENCVVNGTKIIWSSDEFIGAGGNDIEFALFNRIGSAIHSSEYNRTKAELIRADSIKNILESNITITVSRNGTILCRDDSRNIQLNISVIAEPCGRPSTSTTNGACAIPIHTYTGYISSIVAVIIVGFGVNLMIIS